MINLQRPVETYEFSKLENVLTVVVTALQWCDLWDRVELIDVGVANRGLQGVDDVGIGLR